MPETICFATDSQYVYECFWVFQYFSMYDLVTLALDILSLLHSSYTHGCEHKCQEKYKYKHTHTNTAPAACEWFKPYHMSTSSFSDVMLQRAGRQVPISPYIALSDLVTGDRVTNTYIHTGTLFTGSADHRNHYNPNYQGTEGNRHDNVKG